MKKIKICSLFSGIGGFEQGFIQALGEENIEVVFASEIDKYASRSYELIHKRKPHGDITKIEAKEIPDHDLLVGGFPCQAFSIAGKRNGFLDTRGTLFFDVSRILKEKKPKMFLLENVKGLTNHDGGKTFKVITETLKDLGYTVHTKILNSKYFHVPQNRERIYLVGFLEDKPFCFPKQEKVSNKIKDILEEKVDEKYYLREEKVKTFVPKASKREIQIVGNVYPSGHEQGNILSTEGICTTITCRNAAERRILIEGNIEESREHLSRIYSTEGIRATVLCRSDIIKIKENTRIRKLTPLECFRLQSFPDAWYHTLKEQGISNSQLYKMAGNAVTVKVIQRLAEQLKPSFQEMNKCNN